MPSDLNSTPALKSLGVARSFDLELLKAAFREWKTVDDEARAAYVRSRLNIVENYKLTAYDDANLMQTSGSSTGAVRKYRWGPCYQAMFDFFEWLKFGELDCSTFVHVRLSGTGPSITVKDLPIANNAMLSVRTNWIASGNNSAIFMDKLRLTCGSGRDIVVWTIPSFLEEFKDLELPVPDGKKLVVFSTGEKLSQHLRDSIAARGVDVRDVMRCWDGGATFITCAHGNKHWIDLVSKVETEDDGRLVSNDLFNLSQCFLRYRNGDVVDWHRGEKCDCGLPIDTIEFRDRKSSLVMPSGQKFDFETLSMSFSSAFRQRFRSHDNDKPAICSFGYHEMNDALVIYYDFLQDATIDKTSAAGIVELFKSMTGIGSKVYLVNEIQTKSLYKIEKIRAIDEAELIRSVRAAKNKSFRKF